MKQLLMNLNDTRIRLMSLIVSLDPVQLNTRPGPNRWSIAQVCHHLYLTEMSFTEAIKRGLLNDEDIVIERKPIEFILDRSKKLESPKAANPEMRNYDSSEIVDRLNRSRQSLGDLCNGLEDLSVLQRRYYTHVFFQELSLDQWMELLDLHEQRHIEQIKEIQKNV